MAFNILDQVKPLLESNINDGTIKIIDIDLIDYNENNNFSMDTDRINALADEIITVGFKSVVEVREMDNERYEIIAGETRTRAMKLAYEKTHDKNYLKIPAYVSNITDEEARERLVTDELLKRTHTPYEKLMAVEVLQEIYEKKKREEGIPGRIQYMIADASGIKKSQVGTYQKILKDAIPEVKELLNEEKVSIDNAKLLASMRDDEQKEYIENAYDFSKQEIEAFKNHVTEDQLMFNSDDEIVSSCGVDKKLDLEENRQLSKSLDRTSYDDVDEEELIQAMNSQPSKHTIIACLNAIEEEYDSLNQKMGSVEFREERKQLEVAIEEFEKLKVLLLL